MPQFGVADVVPSNVIPQAHTNGKHHPNSCLDAALMYARMGYKVFPTHGVRDGRCMCGNPACGSPGKHPITPHGFKDATTDETVIQAWWKAHPDANVAIATGNGLVVVDIDPRHGGDRTWEELERRHGPVVTWQVKTGGGGLHLYFRTTRPIRSNKALRGIDIKGEGGYVLAPPSSHVSDGRYEWVPGAGPGEVELEAIPDWLLQEIETRATEGNSEAVLSQPVILVGQRHSALVRHAAYLRSLGMRGQALADHLRDIDLARCKDEKGNPAPLSEEDPKEFMAIVAWADGLTVEEALAHAEGKAQVDQRKQPMAYVMDAADLQEMKPPEVRWVIEGILPEGFAPLAGPPKAGKGWMALGAIAVPVALGGYAFGKIRVEQGEVLYLALEDSPARIRRRLDTLQIGRLPKGVLTVATRWRTMTDGGLDDLVKWLDEHPKARLVIIDTLERFRGGKRNPKTNAYAEDYATMAQLQQLALERGIAILAIHHTKKGKAEDWIENLSGSMGLTGAADTILLLERVRNSLDGVLKVTGRDVEEREYAVSLDPRTMAWVLQDASPEEVRQRKESRELLEALRKHGPMWPRDLASLLGLRQDVVRQRMHRLSERGLVRQLDNGKYVVAGPDPDGSGTGRGLHGDHERMQMGQGLEASRDQKLSRLSRWSLCHDGHICHGGHSSSLVGAASAGAEQAQAPSDGPSGHDSMTAMTTVTGVTLFSEYPAASSGTPGIPAAPSSSQHVPVGPFTAVGFPGPFMEDDPMASVYVEPDIEVAM